MPFPLSESELQKTELKLGLRFPDAFRRAMVAMNGGEVLTDEDQWDIYPFFDTSEQKRISRTCNDIIKETEAAKGWEKFPHEGIAIASNGCGDHLFLLPSEADKKILGDQIYAFWHEGGRIEKFADSFDELNK
jgi:hypothetical protein